jgi:AraC-like DNA-binding protein
MYDHEFSKPIFDAVNEIIKAIDNNPLTRKNITSLVPGIYSNRNKIHPAFRKATGKSIKEYRLTKRMETAAKVLTEDNLSKLEIAFKCGYKGKRGASNFSRDFKKVFKMTPKEWLATITLIVD